VSRTHTLAAKRAVDKRQRRVRAEQELGVAAAVDNVDIDGGGTGVGALGELARSRAAAADALNFTPASLALALAPAPPHESAAGVVTAGGGEGIGVRTPNNRIDNNNDSGSDSGSRSVCGSGSDTSQSLRIDGAAPPPDTPLDAALWVHSMGVNAGHFTPAGTGETSAIDGFVRYVSSIVSDLYPLLPILWYRACTFCSRVCLFHPSASRVQRRSLIHLFI
jgi:hypothetical protein